MMNVKNTMYKTVGNMSIEKIKKNKNFFYEIKKKGIT